MDELTSISEEGRQWALDRFRLLQPHLEGNQPLRVVAQQAGIPYRTAQRWVTQYRQFGLAALNRKRRQDYGERRAASPRLCEAIEGLALQKPPLPVTVLYRQLQCWAQEKGETVPSYSVVYDIVRSLPADLLTLAQEGSKAYSDRFELVHRREAAGPNAIWQADHTLLDIYLVRSDGKPAKPWLTVVLDDYSRAVAGYFLSFAAPSALHTSLALRQAIWRKGDPHWTVCGIPDILYTDHGSDFTSRHLEQVSADLRMQLVFSLPGKPRGRGRIERFFSTVNEMFLCELEGYTPASGATRGRPRLTLAEFETRLHAFLLEVYQQRACTETKTAPAARWEANGFLPRLPGSLEQLDLLLVYAAKARRVRRDGLYFQGLRYLSTILAAYVGETVTLRFDPRDMAEVRVFYQERFLCRAVCAELAGATVSLREILRARQERRRELRSLLRDRQRTVDALLERKRGENTTLEDASPPLSNSLSRHTLKRYHNE